MAAVDQQVVAGNIVGGVRRKEDNGSMKVFRPFHVAERGQFADPLPRLELLAMLRACPFNWKDRAATLT